MAIVNITYFNSGPNLNMNLTGAILETSLYMAIVLPPKT